MSSTDTTSKYQILGFAEIEKLQNFVIKNKQLKFVNPTALNNHGSYIMDNDVSIMRKQQDDQKSDLCIMITILVENILIKMKN